jgi:ribA/ribD-fused uncharacterized protein
MPITGPGPRSVADVCRMQDQGRRMKYLVFWGHQQSASGDVGKACLSQWYEGYDFTVDGVTYRTAEHWMMAHKARLFGDEETFARIVEAGHPRQAKELGRKISAFDEATWVARRFEIVTAGNVAKFGRHPDLNAYLLGSRSRILVEASPLDRIWGIGMAADDDHVAQPHLWKGLNLLGFALMEARARLAEVR